MTRVLSGLLTLCLSVAGLGCADVAILELELAIPGNTTPRETLLVQFRADGDFTKSWNGESSVPITLQATPQVVLISIEAQGEQIDQPLQLKLRHCRAQDCNDDRDLAASAEAWVQVPNAFCAGNHTNAAFQLPMLPAECGAYPCDLSMELMFTNPPADGCAR